MEAAYGANWQNILTQKDQIVAAWDTDRANKLQGAQQVVFSEDPNMAALVETYPFLQAIEPQPLSSAPVYFEQIQVTGATILFVEACNGCSLDVYLDVGTGYQPAYVDEGPGPATTVGFFYTGGTISVSSVGGVVTLFFPQSTNGPVTQWQLENNLFETDIRPDDMY